MSAAARSVQCRASPVGLGLAEVVSIQARSMATSQSAQPSSGVQRSGLTPAGRVMVLVGSQAQTWPVRARWRVVMLRMSVLVEVITAGPGHRVTAGMITAEVLPDRGGPMMRAACSGPVKTGSRPPMPR